jgi:5-formyltetrahydrofolate cyclo-ligase
MGTSDVVRTKAALRTVARARLKGITAEQRARDSAAVCHRLVHQEFWRIAERVLCYAPRHDELDIAPVIDAKLAEGKVVALPRFDSATGTYCAAELRTPLAEVALGSFGIREPGLHCEIVSLKTVDLILVPGLAFDLEGRRLGRGRGFYDMLLKGVPGRKWGVAYDEQVHAQIPVETHDILLDAILTPTRWVSCHPGRLGDDFVG